ncbi:Double-stranded RNA-binding protein 6 [Castilleja foliolosa]|uniref:Double-stranded RNA-binding protein 6 n=1 Tax=Castilleja foliolosa TaxID=1961234 RepID=A0ABD3E5L3_9LAMI
MYKNQLQELAQRSCFNLPSYTSIREGPDHAPRFKSSVNFNGETYECPSFCSTLRQAEHSAAEVALNSLASRGPTNSLAARILDETGVYKNLLQEVSQRVGATLPAYTTFRTGLGHLPVFTCSVELAGVIFTGDPAKNKKQAEKNAAMAAWLSLKSLVQQSETSSEKIHRDEQEHVTVARALQTYLIKARLARVPFPIKFPTISKRSSSTQQSPATTSKILPLICPKTAYRNRPVTPGPSFQNTLRTPQSQPMITSPNESHSSMTDNFRLRNLMLPAAGAAPYIPVRHCNPHNMMAPPVTIRSAIPVFSAPPLPSLQQPSLVMRPQGLGMAPPVCVRQAVPVFAAPVCKKEVSIAHPLVKAEDRQVYKSTTARVELPFSKAAPAPNSEVPSPAVQVDLPSSKVEPVANSPPPVSSKAPAEETNKLLLESKAIEDLKGLKI